MKTLNDYVGDKFSALLKDVGGFFAFSQSQFDDAKVEGVEYAKAQHGLVLPKNKFEEFEERNSALWDKAREQRKADFTSEEIIKYELANHEAHIGMDIYYTVKALDGYGYTTEEIQRVFDEVYFPECVEKDLF